MMTPQHSNWRTQRLACSYLQPALHKHQRPDTRASLHQRHHRPQARRAQRTLMGEHAAHGPSSCAQSVRTTCHWNPQSCKRASALGDIWIHWRSRRYCRSGRTACQYRSSRQARQAGVQPSALTQHQNYWTAPWMSDYACVQRHEANQKVLRQLRRGHQQSHRHQRRKYRPRRPQVLPTPRHLGVLLSSTRSPPSATCRPGGAAAKRRVTATRS